jgi:hypothetical protein
MTVGADGSGVGFVVFAAQVDGDDVVDLVSATCAAEELELA